MNTKQIDCILAVHKTKNFTKAAEIVHLTQPSLTYQIQCAEQEVGFQIFMRTPKGAIITPSGLQLIKALESSRQLIHHAIEMGRNVIASYKDTIRIGIPLRSVLYFLPDAMKEFSLIHPEINVVAGRIPWEDPSRFLQGEFDLYCGIAENIRSIPDIKHIPLFKTHIYLVVNHHDPLAEKETASIKDLAGRTLMIGGQAPFRLQELQRKIISTVPLKTYNSYDTLTPFIDIKAEKGIGLVMGTMNDHNEEFKWIPFQEDVVYTYDLCWHKQDTRPVLAAFVKTLRELYDSNQNIPL